MANGFDPTEVGRDRSDVVGERLGDRIRKTLGQLVEQLLNCRGVRRVGVMDLIQALLKSSALPDELSIGFSRLLELPLGLSQLLFEGGFNIPGCMWRGTRDNERDRPIGSRCGV